MCNKENRMIENKNNKKKKKKENMRKVRNNLNSTTYRMWVLMFSSMRSTQLFSDRYTNFSLEGYNQTEKK